MQQLNVQSTRAQISRAAIQRLFISMRHLFFRGTYKPLGVSGESMIEALLKLKPEIYGSIEDPEKVELDGLLYIFQRLPQGIEDCRYIQLISREGMEDTKFDVIMPSKRRRNCYRIDNEQMYIEMTRGRSDIYDVLTHLTFMYIESEKIRRNSLDSKGRKKRDWLMLEQIIEKIKTSKKFNREVAQTYLSSLLGRTYEETSRAAEIFDSAQGVNSIFEITYGLGKLSIDEFLDKNDREINFSSALRQKYGEHIYGESWANNIKNLLFEKELIQRPIHIISSNLHSVMNSFYAVAALKKNKMPDDLESIAEELSKEENNKFREKVRQYALKHGMYEISDKAGTNIGVQVFDCNKMDCDFFPKELICSLEDDKHKEKVIIVMDYAFGEQAYECMDELLKPYQMESTRIKMNIHSINIMGKAGILEGRKGDIMIPTAHVFEGSADNYPFENVIDRKQFDTNEINIFEGPMVTVLGTSLQNRDILQYFHRSSWKAIGLEMEGAHYQKAIQAASKIRSNINTKVVLRYAYYASDNPLETGSTLASGGLGVGGVKSTYAITLAILNGIMLQ